MSDPKIITNYWRKPIPTDLFDWTAWYDGEEELGHYGHGKTEAEAIADLKDSHPRDEEPSPANFEETFGCLGCTCSMSPVHSASIDPPEPVRNRHCPHHGTFDPDAALEARRDATCFDRHFPATGED